VKTAFEVPAFPSSSEVSLTASEGAGSSSPTVARPSPSVIEAFCGAELDRVPGAVPNRGAHVFRCV
jgi:hypothetical protein